MEDRYDASDIDIEAAVPRLKNYWESYSADRPERPPAMARLETLLSQR